MSFILNLEDAEEEAIQTGGTVRTKTVCTPENDPGVLGVGEQAYLAGEDDKCQKYDGSQVC